MYANQHYERNMYSCAFVFVCVCVIIMCFQMCVHVYLCGWFQVYECVYGMCVYSIFLDLIFSNKYLCSGGQGRMAAGALSVAAARRWSDYCDMCQLGKQTANERRRCAAGQILCTYFMVFFL